ncbi:MAG TPA: helix-turn-helix domain-containing protein [Acidimicrobiales bacterium]|nr:helix-turn-helix domain-containing protein [Acidimicrobiales bacterium]
MDKERKEPTPLPQLIDVPGLAAMLAVPERHVRRLIHERRIPFLKWGHGIRFDVDEIRRWLDGARRPPAA